MGITTLGLVKYFFILLKKLLISLTRIGYSHRRQGDARVKSRAHRPERPGAGLLNHSGDQKTACHGQKFREVYHILSLVKNGALRDGG